jgi:hypothetical protein
MRRPNKKQLAAFAEWTCNKGYVKMPFENKWHKVEDLNNEEDYKEQLENKYKSTLQLVDEFLIETYP